MGKLKSKEKDTKKIPVTFNKSQLALIYKYKGLFGNKPSQIIRQIVINWLADRQKREKNGEE